MNAPIARDSAFAADPAWEQKLGDGRTECRLCPRHCQMREGQRGFCFVRGVLDGGMVLTSYGRASGFCIDPIEKKPLNHFFPGTSVLSFGTAGCNLACRFCQNHEISKAREMDRIGERAMPSDIAQAALGAGCRSVAFTYNDPVIFAEYAIDTAYACREKDIESVVVSAGYITPAARERFFAPMSAANIDLKAFTQDFYRNVTLSDLGPVLETLQWLHRESSVWLEVTTLLIEGYNDDRGELDKLCSWFVEHLGPEVPLHFSAFHPDFRMLDVPPTSIATLRAAAKIAHQHGIHHVYTGNVYDRSSQSTSCPSCGEVLIGRNWYELDTWNLNEAGRCSSCGHALAGCFDPAPGTWGSTRRRLRIAPAEIA